MTPTAFEFTVRLPSDPRFVEAARLLAVQAAGYAKLTSDAAAALAADVERETQAAMSAAQAGGTPIELAFAGDDNGVSITISRAGHTRHVRQPVSA
jgi:hypothetical protein